MLIDEVKSYHPKIYEEDFLGTTLSYKFNTYKLLGQDEAELLANPNPFAVVALVVLLALKNKNINDEGLRLIKLDLTKELIKRNVSKSKHIKIMDFLAYYVNFKNPKMMIKFEEEVEQLTGRTRPMGVKEILLERREKEGIQKGIQKGIQEGIQKGIQEGEYKKAVNIALALKTQQIPIEIIAEATGLSIKEIEALTLPLSES